MNVLLRLTEGDLRKAQAVMGKADMRRVCPIAQCLQRNGWKHPVVGSYTIRALSPDGATMEASIRGKALDVRRQFDRKLTCKVDVDLPMEFEYQCFKVHAA